MAFFVRACTGPVLPFPSLSILRLSCKLQPCLSLLSYWDPNGISSHLHRCVLTWFLGLVSWIARTFVVLPEKRTHPPHVTFKPPTVTCRTERIGSAPNPPFLPDTQRIISCNPYNPRRSTLQGLRWRRADACIPRGGCLSKALLFLDGNGRIRAWRDTSDTRFVHFAFRCARARARLARCTCSRTRRTWLRGTGQDPRHPRPRRNEESCAIRWLHDEPTPLPR